MFLKMQKPKSLSLLNIRPSLVLIQALPASTKLFTNLRIMNLRRMLGNSPPLELRPDHKSIHRPLYMIARYFTNRAATGFARRLVGGRRMSRRGRGRYRGRSGRQRRRRDYIRVDFGRRGWFEHRN